MLTKRQEEVLQAIVRQYTTTGQPVGSKALVDHLAKKVSSATIRNEMAVLEHEGVATKEHSSSGGGPAQLGDPFLVDPFLDPLSGNKKKLILI